ncbi:M3 family oligoendopeptidase [Bacillus sp. EAC]|uniref:M3 family oligoendopeptidase n=1 Tax=Bacillus sp. EAC TaxID=1978338 RepID=UPI000B4482E7|nr:M3 family oligoendopeptidase [Bacillus sp. EAC]
MKFESFQYVRPDIEKITQEIEHVLNQFKHSKKIEELNHYIQKINSIRSFFESMMHLAAIQFTRDTKNAFFLEEQKYFDEMYPIYLNILRDYFEILNTSIYRKQLEARWGKQFFSLAELQSKVISKDVLEDLVIENKLVSKYTKLIASAKIKFDNENKNLAQLQAYAYNSNRETRKKALTAKYDFYMDNEEELDTIFNGLVKKRTEIAKKLGYKNYIALGYDRMLRVDFNPSHLLNFRKEIKEKLVPFLNEIRENQRIRTNLTTLTYYDLDYLFQDGSPSPKGDSKWIVQQFQQIFRNLSNETDEFYNFMISNNLVDLDTRENKARAGYCSFLPLYKSPFIFANFNGSSDDVRVFSHEAGHAFQLYSSRQIELVDYHYPTYEACEIHSMSMELLIWQSLDLVFKEDVHKYKYSHLIGAIDWMIYCVAIDEFQHFIYENPDISPSARKKEWRRIEKLYLPFRIYEGNDFLERGGYWQQQTLIYKTPFYFIDYALAQICAFQIFTESNTNMELAISKFLQICKTGGSKSFLSILKEAKLTSPFDDGCIDLIVSELKMEMKKIEDYI